MNEHLAGVQFRGKRRGSHLKRPARGVEKLNSGGVHRRINKATIALHMANTATSGKQAVGLP